MSQNWLRHFELMLLDKEGQGIRLSDFRVTFDIEWFNISTPRVATLKIYNLSQDTSNRILGTEFSKIKVITGYEGAHCGEIFSGDIRFTMTGRDNPTDTYTQIQACDGNEAFIHARVSQTVAAGYTLRDIYSQAMKSLLPYGITEGRTPVMPSTVYPRGRTLYGKTRDLLDQLAGQCKATWQFVDGQCEMLSDDMYVHEAVLLNSNTGLIGMPQQTMGAGVNVCCLINPAIRVNGLIKLDEGSVYRKALARADIQMPGNKLTDRHDNGNFYVDGIPNPPASLAADGVYIVRGILYRGDTRGRSWYTEMMCEARGAKDIASQAAVNR